MEHWIGAVRPNLEWQPDRRSRLGQALGFRVVSWLEILCAKGKAKSWHYGFSQHQGLWQCNGEELDGFYLPKSKVNLTGAPQKGD